MLVILFSCPALADAPEYVEGEVLVVLNAPLSAYSTYSITETAGINAYSQAILYQAEAFARDFGLEALNTFSEIAVISGKSIIHLRSEHKSTEELIQELSSVPYVESVHPNRIRELFEASAAQTTGDYISENAQYALTPNDPHFAEQWGMVNIGMPEVWARTTGSDTICVAVMDTGIAYNHQDINANMTRDSFGNFGRRFKNGAQSSDPMDSDGHGTQVAGIIGAVGNNNIGVAGINWKVKMLAVNVMPDRRAIDVDVINGINYVLSEKNKGLNIRVVNMSFGGWDAPISDNSPFGTAVKSLSDAGIICTIAVGNETENISSPSSLRRGLRVYPACFRFATTISVGSISAGSARSSFSNFSSEWVDIAAPGNSIFSTALNNRYGMLSGTSMSAPHVAGAAALLFAAYPSETATQIKTRILEGARKIGISDGYWKSGILDVAGAYNYSGFNVPVT